MNPTKILWGQIIAVSTTTLVFLWAATEWTAYQLAFQPQLGAPWFTLFGWSFYQPQEFFWWWFGYDAYAHEIFVQGGYIAAAGGVAALAVAVALSVRRARETHRVTTYGSARWANESEIRAVGLLGDKGVVLGRWQGQYLLHDGPEHVLCFAPTRSGKGVGLVVPTLMTWPGSVIVHDIKGENWTLTAGWRARFGRAILFDPTNVDSIPYNPLLEVRRGIWEVRDVQNIADILVDPEGALEKRNHWEKTSHALLVGAILHVLYAEKDKTLAGVANLLSDPARSVEVSEAEAVEMLAQHLITRPVFDALFEGYSFAQHNPVSRAMQGVLEALHDHNLSKETENLQKFYDSVKRRAAGIDSAFAKQKIVVELYDKFFRNAFPKMTERLGIVYTPVEVVDFIIHSVNEVLQSEFGQTLGSKGVHILDPFAGTGTFITRLLQSGLIKPDELEHKYKHEIHANEIVLLAYYIAAINIEAAYHGIVDGGYVPFEGICLTDTFQLYEQDKDLLAKLMPDNSNRRTRQKALDIRVIVGNPPYSDGQERENDNAKNLVYPKLDQRVEETYEADSSAQLRTSLRNSYVRAIRWASDRIGKAGVIGFVTNGGWIEGRAADGLRKSLVNEFSSLYVFHLRGNQRSSGEVSKREGGKIFGGGSRAPIAISILIKNPQSKDCGEILFHDIGFYLSREQKLSKIADFRSIGGISELKGWTNIVPDEHGDWLAQRDKSFGAFIPIGNNKDKKAASVFSLYSSGIKTNRDVWAFNFSCEKLSVRMKEMIAVYNREVDRFGQTYGSASRAEKEAVVDGFVEANAKKISWSGDLKVALTKGRKGIFLRDAVAPAMYRPFTREWVYFDGLFNNSIYQLPKILFKGGNLLSNKVICVSAPGNISGFTAQMTDIIPELCFSAMKGGTQCFPRYIYDEGNAENDEQGSLLLADGLGAVERKRRDAITDLGLAHFQAAYPGKAITKDDLFYYVYGLLHSEDYRARYADNLSKELPRIPAMKKEADFWAFVEAGRKLGDLHCDYEQAEPYPVTIAQGDLRLANIPDPESFYRVEQMKFAGKRPNLDKTTVIYNANVTMTDIPLEAYDYVVNGKPALEWVMERQCVKTDKASGIVNDANRYATETVGDPAYPLKLFQRVITVSLETMKIVKSLPSLGDLS